MPTRPTQSRAMPASPVTDGDDRALNAAADEFEAFLKGKGMRLTRHRRLVLKRLYHLEEHLSADDLYDLLREEDRNISKATVYRTLALLEEANLVLNHDFGRGHRLFEFGSKAASHHHIICVDNSGCEQVVEFESPEIERLIREVTRRHNCQHLYHTVTVFARCIREGCPRFDSCDPGDRTRHHVDTGSLQDDPHHAPVKRRRPGQGESRTGL